MTSPTLPDGAERSAGVDVAVVGGGLAGLATATHLARRGHRVVCLEPRQWPRVAVGESLEFSAAKLLGDVGVDIDDRGTPHLYPKTAVQISGGGDEFTVWPPAWFARAPIWCSRLAFHTDRTVLDEQLRDIATSCGVEVIPERVALVERDHDRIEALVTEQGTRVDAGWYVDASGHNARVLGRALGLDRELLGTTRTAYWARCSEPPDGHATALHFPDPSADDLAWVWEIPLNDTEISVGTVMSTERTGRLRAAGLGPREIFEHHVATVPRLRRVLGEHPDVDLEATTYEPYRHRRTVGPNWILVGDAAAMVDPLTSNGVTSALRHAQGAQRLVSGALQSDRCRRRDAWIYQHTAPANIATLDGAIETFLYEPRIRQRLGLRWAVTLYAATGVVTNSLYAKTKPTSLGRAASCAAILAASRAWTRTAGAALARPLRSGRPPGAVSSAPTDADRLIADAHPDNLPVPATLGPEPGR